MKQWKRLIYYLILNILVSAATTYGVLYYWDITHPGLMGGGLPLVSRSTGLAATEAVKPQVSLTATGSAAAPTPQAIQTQPPETEPPKSVDEYKVKDGDTLMAIAGEFGVDMDLLMEVNALTDPNSLSVGMVLYIPTTPQPTPTSEEPTATRTQPPSSAATGKVTPTSQPQPARVVINTVIGAGDLATERVFLTRLGDGKISLADWTLEDEDGNIFTFPQLELYKDGAVNVWTSTGTPTVVDLYWGLSQAAWKSGETVTLRDASGKIQATYQIP